MPTVGTLAITNYGGLDNKMPDMLVNIWIHNTMRLVCISWLMVWVFPVLAQPVTLPKSPIQQRTTGDIGQDELLSLTTNWRGDIATLGNVARGDQGGQDISFVAYDAQLNLITERHIGRSGDDGSGQIATLPDGRYVLAGYSTRPGGRTKTRVQYYGKRDGWLLKLNEKGDTEQELILGTEADDSFVTLATCPDGSMWVAGNTGDQAWIVRVSANFEVVWEKRIRYHGLPTNIAASTLLSDGDFYVVGNTTESNRQFLWIAGFNEAGKVILEKTYPGSQAETGTGITQVDTQTLAIVGTVNDPRNRENGFISLLDKTGVMRHYYPLGGREFDQINNLTRLHNGQLLTAGGSASFERGSRRISAWLSVLEPAGQLNKEHYYGSKVDDQAFDVIEHPNGGIFVTGTTNRQVLKMRQGWIFQLTSGNISTASPGSLKTSLNLMSSTQNKTINPGDRIYIPFSLTNSSQTGYCQLRATVNLLNNTKGADLRIPAARSILIPPISANTTINWGLPLQFESSTPPGIYTVEVHFFQGERSLGPPQTLDVMIGERSVPQLSIHVIPPANGLVTGQEQLVKVEVSNTGTVLAKGLTLTVQGPAGVKLPQQISLGDLAAKGKTTYQVPITATNSTVGPSACKLSLRVMDSDLLHDVTTEARLDVISPVNIQNTSENAFTVAVWVYPNPDNFDRSELVWTQEEITIQLKIISNQSVSRQQFCLEINGQPCQTGQKFDEVQIKGERNSKTFSQPVKLREGENLLQANIKTDHGSIKSEPLKIIYSPAKPNLHIVSIGIPAADLKYTTKDARDFARKMASSQNAAFGKIFLDTLLNDERTTKTEILKTLRRLQYRYSDLQILPEDLLVIFVSGHGLGTHDGNFRLAASDYDGPFLQETSLDFEQEIVNYLQNLPCNKLFFVDACQSGTASGKGLAGIATRKNNLNMMVSCQPDEYSYEDDHWQNGAFTHALVRGLDIFTNQPASLDSNSDTQLDAVELFGFIEKQVPLLVEKKRPKVSTGQRPKLFLTEPGLPIVIFK